MGMGSVFFDVLNHLVVDAALHPCHTSEKPCVAEHLEHSLENDLILYDRGYGAFWLYALHRQLDRAFCLRAKIQQDRIFQAFVASGEKQAWVSFTPNASSRVSCRKRGLCEAPITLRLVRVELPNEVEVLVTNLVDAKCSPVAIFKSLYHLRWGIEENYKRLKQWVEIANFSGKSALSVKQDFYAKIVAANLTAVMVLEAQRKVSKNTAHRQHRYQVNFAYALSTMKHQLVLLIVNARYNINARIDRCIHLISQCYEAVRPGRQYPRRKHPSSRNMHYNAYKGSF
jgi:hypothetical protein